MGPSSASAPRYVVSYYTLYTLFNMLKSIIVLAVFAALAASEFSDHVTELPQEAATVPEAGFEDGSKPDQIPCSPRVTLPLGRLKGTRTRRSTTSLLVGTLHLQRQQLCRSRTMTTQIRFQTPSSPRVTLPLGRLKGMKTLPSTHSLLV